MNSQPFCRTARPRGFTLIELLVVISIIALLVTGAFGAYGFIMEKAKRSEAQSTCMAVSTGIDNFFTEYDMLPQPISATKGTDCDTDTSAEEGLVMILKGLDETQNPRKQDFLGDIKDAKMAGTREGERKVGGLIREGETIQLVDPWGYHFKVTLDLDMDKKVVNPDEDAVASGITDLHKTALVWSIGKDGDPKIWKDNVASWATAQ
jgi:prepilin-type N-terminal cleavage/methylation domain-containing protein